VVAGLSQGTASLVVAVVPIEDQEGEPSSAAPGPYWVRAATVEYGQQRAPTVANGSEKPQVAGPPAHAAGMMHAGDSDCGPEGRGSAPSGSRRAATGGCNDRGTRPQTVEDHDRRFCH
jgi:hypothetical protein